MSAEPLSKGKKNSHHAQQTKKANHYLPSNHKTTKDQTHKTGSSASTITSQSPQTIRNQAKKPSTTTITIASSNLSREGDASE